METTTILPSFNGGMTKKQVEELSILSVENVLEEGNFFQAAEALSAMEDFVKKVRGDERFCNGLLDELQKSSGKLTTSSGAAIEQCEAGIKYDYSNDGVWKVLNAEKEKIDKAMKDREAILKRIPAGKLLVDEDTGESIVGPVKTSKTTYKITLAKA
jgi:hypothetical protein